MSTAGFRGGGLRACLPPPRLLQTAQDSKKGPNSALFERETKGSDRMNVSSLFVCGRGLIKCVGRSGAETGCSWKPFGGQLPSPSQCFILVGFRSGPGGGNTWPFGDFPPLPLQNTRPIEYSPPPGKPRNWEYCRGFFYSIETIMTLVILFNGFVLLFYVMLSCFCSAFPKCLLAGQQSSINPVNQ